MTTILSTLGQIAMLLFFIFAIIALLVILISGIGLGWTWFVQFIKAKFKTPRRELSVLEDIDRVNRKRNGSSESPFQYFV